MQQTQKLTSSLYSKKTLKFWSLRRVGWAASRQRKTSCMATVFLNVARYSLQADLQTSKNEAFNQNTTELITYYRGGATSAKYAIHLHNFRNLDDTYKCIHVFYTTNKFIETSLK